MQSPEELRVIPRVQKLLALARDHRANEAEAMLAMERAQEIMREYNLQMATVEAGGGKAEGRTKDKTDKKLMFKWQRELFTTVAKVNFCYFSLTFKETKSGERIAGGYEIIRRQSNVIGARNMYEYLAATIARLVKEHCGPSSSDQFTKYANQYRLGCVARLSERLDDRHRQRIEEQSRAAREARVHPGAATANALVVVMDE